MSGIVWNAFGHRLDAVGAVTFHPLQSVLLSVSGSRDFDHDDALRYASNTATEDNSEVSSDSESASDVDGGKDVRHSRFRGIFRRTRTRPQPTVRDASIKLWDFGVGKSVRMADQCE